MLTSGKAHQAVRDERLIPEPDARKAAADDEDTNGRCPGQPARARSLLSIPARCDRFHPRAHERTFDDHLLPE
jgi:hypothetical protein